MEAITNYRLKFIEYKKTYSYMTVSETLKKAGIKQPYRDNIISDVFAQGWNASADSGGKIKYIKKP